MGMFDYVVPRNPINCPKCGSELKEWQTKSIPADYGMCELVTWYEGEKHPTDTDGNIDYGREFKYESCDKYDLPDAYEKCDGCGLFVDIELHIGEDGLWHGWDWRRHSPDVNIYRKDWAELEEEERLAQIEFEKNYVPPTEEEKVKQAEAVEKAASELFSPILRDALFKEYKE